MDEKKRPIYFCDDSFYGRLHRRAAANQDAILYAGLQATNP
jgi:hypothetical protein